MEKGRPSEDVVTYLARYASRVTIANNRLHRIENGEVYYSYKDYRNDGEWKQEHLPGVTFLETFLQHDLPPGIHNKRRYGFCADREPHAVPGATEEDIRVVGLASGLDGVENPADLRVHVGDDA